MGRGNDEDADLYRGCLVLFFFSFSKFGMGSGCLLVVKGGDDNFWT